MPEKQHWRCCFPWRQQRAGAMMFAMPSLMFSEIILGESIVMFSMFNVAKLSKGAVKHL